VWVAAKGAESSVKSHKLDAVREDHKDQSIENAVVAVGIQHIVDLLVVVVILAIPFVAKELVLDTVLS